ncbi:MFS transporter [Balneatrix alpica]|uniref:MFS transporter n=1 Tax=Balneatrix alpica TaxID=75684 RepID=UPI0027386A14|nr:MFS transporter [Balneatrix alpica]
MARDRTLFLLTFTVTLGVAGFSLPSPILAPMLLDPTSQLLPASSSEWARQVWLGVVMALYPLFQLLGAPWLGRLSDRHGRKPVMLLSLLGVAAGFALMGIGIAQESLILILLSRVMEGWFNGNIAIAQAMVADQTQTGGKARAFALLTAGMNLGWIIGPLLGGYGAELSGSYATPAWLALGLTLFNFSLLLWGLPAQSAASQQPLEQRNSESLWRSNLALLLLPRLLPYFVLTLLCYLAVQLYFTYFNLWLVQELNFSPVDLAYAAVWVSLPMMLGSWISHRLAQHFRNSSLGIAGHLLMMVGMATFILPDSQLGLFWTFIPAGIGMTLGELATSVVLSNRAPADRQGQVMGLYRSVSLGSELLVVAFGSLLLLWGGVWVFIAAAVFALAGALGFAYLRLRRQSQALVIETGEAAL